MIVVDLIYNLTMLVALSVVSGFIDQRWDRSTRSGQLLQGTLFGGAALIAMLRPLNLGPGLIFDGRSVVVSLCGLFFGPLAAALAGIMTVVLRLALGGSGTLMGVLVISSSALIGVFFHRRWQSRTYEIRAGQLWLFGLLVHAVMLALTFTLPDNAAPGVLSLIGLPVITTYPIATVLIGKILSDQASHSHDVAALKQSKAALHQERQLLRSVIDNLPDAIYIKDTQLRKVLANQADLDNIGVLDEGAILGKTDWEVFPPEVADRFGADDRAILETGQPVLNREELLVNVHGQRRWLLTSKLPLRDPNGRISGILGIGHDITARKQLEQALAVERDSLEQRVIDRTRELAAANDRLQDLDRLKNKFVSDVSHELRTPVTSLLLYLDLLEHGKPEKRAHYLTSAIDQARRMQQLIENILDLSRLERDTARPVFEPIDLNAVLERVVLAQQPRAEAAGLQLVFEAASDLPPVRGDVNHLLQVMTNLIANAISYTPAGAVHVMSSVQSNCVLVEVRDTGLGIAPEDLPHLFERFYRGQLTRHVTGTGLGLAIVNEIVETHGGRIEVSSEVGVGSTFRVYLPHT